MRRMSGRGSQKYDEQWICVNAIAERSQGGLGPFSHKGDVWTVSYVLRSPENRAAVDALKMKWTADIAAAQEAKKQIQIPDLSLLNNARPGDIVVDRSLRTVYLIHEDGSRRRCWDTEACTQAITAVKQLIEAVKQNATSRK